MAVRDRAERGGEEAPDADRRPDRDAGRQAGATRQEPASPDRPSPTLPSATPPGSSTGEERRSAQMPNSGCTSDEPMVAALSRAAADASDSRSRGDEERKECGDRALAEVGAAVADAEQREPAPVDAVHGRTPRTSRSTTAARACSGDQWCPTRMWR